MPLFNSQADGNVPPLPGRARYSVVTDRSSSWVFHKMDPANQFNGEPPAVDINRDDVSTIDPAVGPGYASWDNLAHGGLFTLLAHMGSPILVSEISNVGGATISTVDLSGSVLRPAVPATPFLLSPGECLKVVGGPQGAKVGFLCKIDEATIL